MTKRYINIDQPKVQGLWFSAPSDSPTDTLQPGMVVCLDPTETSDDGKRVVCTRPEFANWDRPAFLVHENSRNIADGQQFTAIPLTGRVSPGVPVRVNTSVAAGDYLGIVPGEYHLYEGVGRIVARTLAAIDGSTTPTTGLADIGELGLHPSHLAGKTVRFGDPFVDNISYSETANLAKWLLTVIDGGPDNGEIITIADAVAGGKLSITTNDANNDACTLQLNGEAFHCGEPCLFIVQGLSINDADTADWFVGLQATDTSPLDSAVDRIGFGVPAGDSAQDLIFHLEQDSTETATDTGTNVADATPLDLAFFTDGNGNCRFFVNGVRNTTALVVTNLPDDAALTPTITVRNASAAASNLLIGGLFIDNAR